jgi:hypothetical protein
MYKHLVGSGEQWTQHIFMLFPSKAGVIKWLLLLLYLWEITEKHYSFLHGTMTFHTHTFFHILPIILSYNNAHLLDKEIEAQESKQSDKYHKDNTHHRYTFYSTD